MALANPVNEFTLNLRRTLNAPQQKVFEAWTQAEALKQWFAPSSEYQTKVAELEVKTGGKYKIVMLDPEGSTHTVAGEYVSISPYHQLIFTWAWIDKDDPSESLVTIDMIDQGDQTELVLTHEKLPDQRTADLHHEGWTGCLDRLLAMLA